MPDPTSTSAGAGIALGAVTITGTILGMHVDALLIGCAVAMCILLNQPPAVPRTPLAAFGFVFAAALAAGIGAPLAVLVAVDQWDGLQRLDAQVLRIIAAAMIAATAHLAGPAVRDLVPTIIDRLRGLIGGTR